MFLSIAPKKIYIAYLTFFALNGIFLIAFHNVFLNMFAFILSWWALSDQQKIIHIDGDYISASTVLFDFLVRRFFKKIYIPDIEGISIRIDHFRFNSWKQIVITDKNGNKMNFTMNMYDPNTLQQVFSYFTARNSHITFDDATNEIAVHANTQTAEDVHASYDFRMGVVLLIAVVLVAVFYIWHSIQGSH